MPDQNILSFNIINLTFTNQSLKTTFERCLKKSTVFGEVSRQEEKSVDLVFVV